MARTTTQQPAGIVAAQKAKASKAADRIKAVGNVLSNSKVAKAVSEARSILKTLRPILTQRADVSEKAKSQVTKFRPAFAHAGAVILSMIRSEFPETRKQYRTLSTHFAIARDSILSDFLTDNKAGSKAIALQNDRTRRILGVYFSGLLTVAFYNPAALGSWATSASNVSKGSHAWDAALSKARNVKGKDTVATADRVEEIAKRFLATMNPSTLRAVIAVVADKLGKETAGAIVRPSRKQQAA